jgi:NAD+ kinase
MHNMPSKSKLVGLVLKPGLDPMEPSLQQMLTGLLLDPTVKFFLDADPSHAIFEAFYDRVIPASGSAIVDLCDYVISLGGDGTMLGVMRDAGQNNSEALLIGVNMGTLGFITDIELADAVDDIRDILNGMNEFEDRHTVMLSAGGSSHVAANDILLQRASGRLLDFRVDINDRFAYNCRADGLLLSTPTGSTAYSLSSGGPIIDPTCKVLLLSPLMPQNLSSRPIVLNIDAQIKVTLTGEQKAIVYIDGNELQCPECNEYFFSVGPSVSYGFVKRPGDLNGRNFTKALRNKLGWNT